MWDGPDQYVRWMMAASASVAVGHAAMDAAIAEHLRAPQIARILRRILRVLGGRTNAVRLDPDIPGQRTSLRRDVSPRFLPPSGSRSLVIQSVDFVLVEPLITDLHPGAEGPARAQFYDSVVDRLSRCRETPVIGVASSPPRQMQFCR